MTALIEIRGLERSFAVKRGIFSPRTELKAVAGVDLDLMKGEVLAIVGESGCGKSTLAKLLLGLLPPSRGTIRFFGRPITDVPRAEIARRMQPVFQDPYSSLNPRRRIASIVAFPLAVQGVGTAESRRIKAIAALERVGLGARHADSFPSQLSGGQRQRVAIARALVTEPQIVVCDEPTSALDVSVQAQILNLLADLRRDLGLTYIFISHNLAVVEHVATRVAVMYLGRIVELGETRQIFSSPRHPYTEALLASALTPVPGLGIPDAGLGEASPDPLALPSGCTFHPRCRKRFEGCDRDVPVPTVVPGGVVRCHLHGRATGEAIKVPG